MQIVSPELIKGKKVLLRLDIDVPIENGKILEPYRLESGLETLKLCLEHAESVTCMGHIGRPGGVEVPELSVAVYPNVIFATSPSAKLFTNELDNE